MQGAQVAVEQTVENAQNNHWHSLPSQEFLVEKDKRDSALRKLQIVQDEEPDYDAALFPTL